MTSPADDVTVIRARRPDPELKRLAPLIGTWTAEEDTLDSLSARPRGHERETFCRLEVASPFPTSPASTTD
jgi:hypothetical protein